MLIYALLHLLGYEAMTIDQIKRFRQFGSITAGHPEHGHAPGIETTTGPLGQGLGAAVGMAIAERHLAAEFGADIVDHRTFVLASDGDLMEGISQEAIALAGHLRLNKLVGAVTTITEFRSTGRPRFRDSVDQLRRFEACGWAATQIDGHDPEAIAAALSWRDGRGPTGAHRLPHDDRVRRPDQGGHREVPWRAARRRRNQGRARAARLDGGAIRSAGGYSGRLACRRRALAPGARRMGTAGSPAFRLNGAPRSTAGWPVNCRANCSAAVRRIKETLAATPREIATRAASEFALETLTAAVPDMVGGSADLTGSNNTRPKGMAAFSAARPDGRFIHYGIREHGMAAAMNGMALHGGIIPYSGTFLVFSDYCRPAIRLAALMGQRVIHVMTHDSIGLGEDGPTHQPVEHLAALRAMPNLNVFRPCDAVETAECWELALMARRSPSVLALTRQNLPQLRAAFAAENRCAAGAYELLAAEGREAQVSLFASGSEVAIAADARKLLASAGVAARVVSVPCFELFFSLPHAGPGRRDRQRAGTGRHRGGDPAGLGRHHRHRRRLCRHDGLWRQRARRRSLSPFRHYGGARRRGGVDQTS